MTLNLYMVQDADYDWCCFVFDVSRNKAKSSVAEYFGYEYTDMRCKTLKKSVNFPYPKIVDCESEEGYGYVKQLGYEYVKEDDYYDL